MPRFLTLLSIVVLMLVSSGRAAPSAAVIDDFSSDSWEVDPASTTGGRVDFVAGPTGRTLVLEPAFSGTFGGFTARPKSALAIPGELKSVSLRVEASDPRYGLRVTFKDGWNRTEVNGKPLVWEIPARNATAGGKPVTFTVPADWVQPMTIVGLGTHNWAAQSETGKVRLEIGAITGTIDLSGVDAGGRLTRWRPNPNSPGNAAAPQQAVAIPVLQSTLLTAATANVFLDADPHVTVRLRNWTSEPQTAEVNLRITDDRQRVISTHSARPTVTGLSVLDVPLKTTRYGLYTVTADTVFADGTRRSATLSAARLPRPQVLTDAQKDASPYGINFHGPGNLLIQPFRDAGIVWFREYAFNLEWLQRARGDGQYAGWPFYPKIVQAYVAAGARVVACLQGAIKAPAVKDGAIVGPVGPGPQWTRDIADVILHFPQIRVWEAANEYDLPAANAAAERLCDWTNYQAYHARLGELTTLLGGGQLKTVENGRAGIWPGLVRDCVTSGSFAKIDVVNSHHYTGTETPEENYTNFNTASDAWSNETAGLLFDRLRQTTRAASADGRPREHWLTEFGWDTLAGPVVTPQQQAAYLQRGWMLALAAGCSKAFWFYNFDNPKPHVFFDGCGLLTADAQPKLSLCAMAGLTALLPTPRFVGTIDAGPGTGGYVFEQDGKAVAVLFALRGEGPTVRVKAEQLYDYLANPIEGDSVALSMFPVYAVGLEAADPLMRQTAYSIDSDHRIAAASGDEVEAMLLIDNRRSTPIQCDVQIALPGGWTSHSPSMRAEVPPGEKHRLPIRFTVGPGRSGDAQTVAITVRESGMSKQMNVAVVLQPVALMAVSPLSGPPGETPLTVRVANRSRTPLSGTVSFRLPGGWSIDNPQFKVADLAPGESRAFPTRLTWRTGWKDDETATAEMTTTAGLKLTQPIIPNRLTLHRATNIKLDGDLSDWPTPSAVPAWMLGSTSGPAAATVRLAWAEDGLYGAAEVHGSDVRVGDPMQFWTGDVLELLLNTAEGTPTPDFGPAAHQLWLVPQPDGNSVFVGRWKVKNEIPASVPNLPGVRSAAKALPNGYAMEFFIPAASLHGFVPKVGGQLGLNVNLGVKSRTGDREVFWPQAKSDGVRTDPSRWGTAELAE